MKQAICAGPARTGRMVFYVVVLALVGFQLTTAFSTHRAKNATAPWRERDWRLWYQAQQLFHCDPEELTEPELHEVERWCRCLSLVAECPTKGIEHWTDDECAFVADALDDFVPNLAKHGAYLPIYQACRLRLASAGQALQVAVTTSHGRFTASGAVARPLHHGGRETTTQR